MNERMISEQDVNTVVQEKDFLAVGAEPHSQMLGNGTFAVVMISSDINGRRFNFSGHIAYWEQTPSCTLT